MNAKIEAAKKDCLTAYAKLLDARKAVVVAVANTDDEVLGRARASRDKALDELGQAELIFAAAVDDYVATL